MTDAPDPGLRVPPGGAPAGLASSAPPTARRVRARQRPAILIAGGGTGGHLYPALAIARALTALAPELGILLIGARRGIERTVLPNQPFRFELLDLHPLYRPAIWRNWRTVWGAAGSWRRLAHIVSKQRPRLVLGTGGYASALTLAYAVSHRIPIVQQVADSHPGLTARWFIRYCREAYLGYPEAVESLGHHAGTELIDTGNPIEPPPARRPDPAVARDEWGLSSDVTTVLLIFGGSQGARGINTAVNAWLGRPLPEGLGVIWATGPSMYADYSYRAGPRVRVRPYLAPIADAYAASDLVLARAGAMTTAELCAWGLPMVLVPLPTAAADHQTANARALEAAGAAIHLPQRELTPESIAQVVGDLVNDPVRRAALAAAARARGRPGASEDIARRILSLIDLR